MTRSEIIGEAAKKCLKELYLYAFPKITWEDFMELNKEYSIKYKQWEEYKKSIRENLDSSNEWRLIHPDWENKSITECIGPKPFEFYSLPREIMKDICDSYVHAYKMDNQQELLDTIETLKNYCKEPIVDKYIDDWTDETGPHPGYRSYDHPDNLQLTIYRQSRDMFPEGDWKQFEEISKMSQNKFFEFLDMAGKFFNWNRELNSFNVSVYLGASPNSNKKAVIENWKKYRNQDIEINEEQIKKDYYGEDDFDE